MDLLPVISIITLVAGVIVLYHGAVRQHRAGSIAGPKADTAAEPKIECWVCASCSQYNRTDAPYYLDQIRCQNCHTVKGHAVEYHPITLSAYWNQARFQVESDRRKAEKEKKPWIDPSIAPKGTGRYTIDFTAPQKQMPDDLKDKISRN